jgi:hypothetical protein
MHWKKTRATSRCSRLVYPGLGTSQRFGELLLGSAVRAALLSVPKVFAPQDMLDAVTLRGCCVGLWLGVGRIVRRITRESTLRGQGRVWAMVYRRPMRRKMLDRMRWSVVKTQKNNFLPTVLHLRGRWNAITDAAAIRLHDVRD